MFERGKSNARFQSLYVTHAISYSVLVSIKVYLILFVLHFSTKTAMSIIGSKTDRYLLDD